MIQCDNNLFIKKTTSPTCTHCNNHPLTITHILHECHTTETQIEIWNQRKHKPYFSKRHTKSTIISKKHKLLLTHLMVPSLMTSLSMQQ